jgi:hypothetical protein
MQTWGDGMYSAGPPESSPSFGAPEAPPAGPGITSDGTWLGTIFAADDKIRVGGSGPLTAIDTSNPAHKVDPLAAGYSNGAYLVGFDVPTGCYRLTAPAGGAQYEIFDGYSHIRECSTPTGSTTACHAGGTTINMRFTSGSRILHLVPGDYILHYIGTLTKIT